MAASQNLGRPPVGGKTEAQRKLIVTLNRINCNWTRSVVFATLISGVSEEEILARTGVVNDELSDNGDDLFDDAHRVLDPVAFALAKTSGHRGVDLEGLKGAWKEVWLSLPDNSRKLLVRHFGLPHWALAPMLPAEARDAASEILSRAIRIGDVVQNKDATREELRTTAFLFLICGCDNLVIGEWIGLSQMRTSKRTKAMKRAASLLHKEAATKFDKFYLGRKRAYCDGAFSWLWYGVGSYERARILLKSGLVSKRIRAESALAAGDSRQALDEWRLAYGNLAYQAFDELFEAILARPYSQVPAASSIGLALAYFVGGEQFTPIGKKAKFQTRSVLKQIEILRELIGQSALRYVRQLAEEDTGFEHQLKRQSLATLWKAIAPSALAVLWQKYQPPKWALGAELRPEPVILRSYASNEAKANRRASAALLEALCKAADLMPEAKTTLAERRAGIFCYVVLGMTLTDSGNVLGINGVSAFEKRFRFLQPFVQGVLEECRQRCPRQAELLRTGTMARQRRMLGLKHAWDLLTTGEQEKLVAELGIEVFAARAAKLTE